MPTVAFACARGLCQRSHSDHPAARSALASKGNINADGPKECLAATQPASQDRVWPPRKGQPISVPMPAITDSRDALAAIAAICKALERGELTPDEVTALSSVVGRSIQVIELQDIERRIAALEEARDKRDEEKNSLPG